MTDMSLYEQNAHREIDHFKNPERSWLGNVWEKVNEPVEWIADKAFDSAIGAAVAKAVQGLVSVLNDGASWSVRTDAIYGEFRSDGHSRVCCGADIHRLDLRDVDKTVGYLAAKYKMAALAEGAGTGTLGAAGIAFDIPALVSLALRAVNEYATYYGFDVSLQHEQAYAMVILSAASSPTVAAKQITMAELTKLSVLIAQALGIRLTKAKLAQIVPLVGAAVGGGFNAWYLARVTETAYHLYRERFLIEKYGPDVAIPSKT